VSDYAPWARRAAATAFDLLLLAPFLVVGLIGSTPPAVLVVLLAAAVAVDVWNRGVRQGRTGASLGKQAVEIVVVTESDGLPLGTSASLVRHVVHLVDALTCFVGFLWPLWDEKRQTFADKIMATVVLHLPAEA